MTRIIVVSFATLCMFGCGAADQSPNGSASESEQATEFLYQTHVTLHPDGKHEVITIMRPKAEQIADAQNRARVLADVQAGKITMAQAEAELYSAKPVSEDGLGATAQAISQSGCVLGDMNMFEQKNFGGNELCLTGTGTTTLSLYTRGCCGTWYHATGSYYSGGYKGTIYSDGPFYLCGYPYSRPIPYNTVVADANSAEYCWATSNAITLVDGP